MILVRKETQSLQVSKFLEKRIVSGEIGPETKLNSTREMADVFSVSQQVIKSAMNILEEKELIVRKPRKGIYVAKNVFTPQQKDIICLKVGYSDLFTDYSEKFFSTNNHPAYKFLNFVTKSIATENFTGNSFTYELSKLIEADPDCVLISIPQMSEPQVKQCLELPFPVIFIGDFSVGEFPELEYNQMVEDTGERAEAALATAIELDKKHIVCLAGPLEAFYNKIYYKKAKAVAKKNGVALEYVEHTDGEQVLELVRQKRIDTISRNVATFKKADAIVIDGFEKLGLFAEIFEQQGLKFPGKRVVIADGGMYPGCTYVSTDYSDLSQAAMQHIQDIIENPEKTKKIVLSGLIKRKFFSIG